MTPALSFPANEQLGFIFRNSQESQPGPEHLRVGSRTVLLRFTRNEAARRYILRMSEDGSARVTVPRRGSLKSAREFVGRHLAWIEKQLQKRATRPAQPPVWAHGTEILFRGEATRLQVEPDGKRALVGDQSVALAQSFTDLRPTIERQLRIVSSKELVARTWELAAVHQVIIRGVTVRNQRSRWGSCSARKTISLNWRLIQTPPFVRDYIILHELMHLREMNHSPRFWHQVQQVCPDYAKAESWLNQHGGLLRAGVIETGAMARPCRKRQNRQQRFLRASKIPSASECLLQGD